MKTDYIFAHTAILEQGSDTEEQQVATTKESGIDAEKEPDACIPEYILVHNLSLSKGF